MAYITNEIKSVEGANILIQDSDQKQIVDLQLKGNTTQDGTPTPDSPQPINVVSGDNEIVVTGKNIANWIQGNVNAQGQFVSSTTSVCTDFIKVNYNDIFTASKNTLFDSSTNDNMMCRMFDKDKNILGSIQALGRIQYSNSFTINNANCEYIRLAQFKSDGILVDNNYELMIENGSTASEYEEYKRKSYEINLGKNILHIIDNTTTYNGITAVGSEDGTITLNGTATANSFIANFNNLMYLESGTYTLSLNNATTISGTANTNLLRLVNESGSSISGAGSDFTVVNNTKTFTLSESGYYRFQIRTNNGTTYDNFVIKPQLEKGSVASPYSVYKTPIELCKIGDYQDRIYKDSGKWYIEKQIGKVVLNGSEDWNINSSGTSSYSYRAFIIGDIAVSNIALSNYYTRVNISNTNTTQGLDLRTAPSGYEIRIRYGTEDTTTNFKNWLSTHNTTVYYVLATPTYTEITDSELINQLNAPTLLEGVNNISINSEYLSSPLKISYCSTENEYYEKIYSQDEKTDLKIWFNNVELEDAPIKCEKITRNARILPDDGNKVFSLDNFISTNIEIILHNVDLEDIQDQVKISIGTLMDDNTYKYIPLGIFNIQDTPVNDNGKITLKLRDNRVKFDFLYNGQELIERLGGSATKMEILEDICSQAGVINTIDSFNGDSDLIGIYDNTITGTTYVSYLMEQAGLIPIIDREGQLKAIDLSNPYIWKIPLSILQTGFEIGEPYTIERICYESGIIKYETSSDESLNTLYLNALNPYISNREQVEYILEKLKYFVIDSVTTKNVLGNPAIDPYDLIQVYNDLDGTNNIVFETLANTTYTYNGVQRDIFNTQIDKEKRKENVSLKGEASVQLYARASIDNVNARITTEVGQTNENLNNLSSIVDSQGNDIDTLGTVLTQTTESITANVSAIQETLENGVDLVKTTSVSINNNGINVSTDLSKIATIISNNAFKIVPKGSTEPLAFFGYDEEQNISVAKMDNLTITTYLNTGTHRIEKYEEDGEERTGFFYIGG